MDRKGAIIVLIEEADQPTYVIFKIQLVVGWTFILESGIGAGSLITFCMKG